MSRFYGELRVLGEEEDGDHVILQFKDGKTMRLTKRMRDLSVTKKPIDTTQLWDKQVTPLVTEILTLMLEWDIQVGDQQVGNQVEYLLNLVRSSVAHNLAKASDIIWNTPMTQRRMSDINKTILDNEPGSEN